MISALWLHHRYALITALVSLAVMIGGFYGCAPTATITTPGPTATSPALTQKMTEAQLNQWAVQQQANDDIQALKVKADQAAASQAAAAATTPAQTAAASQQSANAVGEAQTLAIQIQADNAKLTLAFAQIDQQKQAAAGIVNAAINAAQHPADNPLSTLLGFILASVGALGVGSMVDSARKSNIINSLQNPPPAPLPAVTILPPPST